MNSIFEKNISPIMSLILKRLAKFWLWEEKKVWDCLRKISQSLPKGIQTKEYYKEGKYPIIDQWQSFIGWYSDNFDIVDFDLPLIVFWDHTRNIKYVDFPFVIGADWVKLYKPKDTINEKFFYYALNSINLWSRWYWRHNKLMQESEVYIPNDKKLQEKIVAFLEDLKEWTIKNQEYFNKNIENDVLRYLERISLIIKFQENSVFDKGSIWRLHQSILQDAIQGKLVPQNPNDEPASELLKKIKAEKEQLIKEKKIKKSKEFTPIIDDEKPFDLPKGWGWIRLGEIIYSVSDWPHFSPNYVDPWKWIMFLSARNIKIWKIDLSDLKYISYNDHNEFIKRTKPEKWDILYTKWWTTWIAKINDLDEEFSIWVHVALLKFNQRLNFNKYLELSLNSPFCYEQSQKYTHWISNRDLWLTRMIDIMLPLPPLAEQKRIVTKVDELIKFCDNLEKQISEAKENGERLMESVLGEVFK